MNPCPARSATVNAVAADPSSTSAAAATLPPDDPPRIRHIDGDPADQATVYVIEGLERAGYLPKQSERREPVAAGA